MRFTTARRWLAGVGVAGALVATAAAPATAGAPAGKLDVFFADTTIAAGSAGKIESPVLYSTSGPLTLHELTIRYDFADLAGKVKVAEEDEEFGDCTPSGATALTCTIPYPIDIDEQGLAGVAWVVLAPTKEAEDGDEGNLKVSVSAAGIDTVTHTAKIRVGEGVDLAAGDELTRSGKPGGKVSTPLTVANNGESTIQGAVAVFYNDYAFRSTTRFSNCTYADEDLLTCKFDEALAPGGSYSATLPYTIGADTEAPGGAYGEIVWMTTAEFEDYVAYLADRGVTDLGKPGTDGELDLTQAGGVQARGQQADTNPENNWSSVALEVTGKNGADLSAIGATLTGEAGDVVTAKLGLRNEGPATIDATRGGGSFTNVHVTIPTGTTAVGVPENCSPRDSDGSGDWEQFGKTGAPAYHCYSESFIKVGDQHAFEFKLRIDKVVPNATGSIEINIDCPCEGRHSDLDGSNDEAKILVNATEEGGGGGGLPVTGASTGIVAAAGLLLLAAGVFGFVLARRRRTRFVA
ncbi:LPXTG cell wall anchor domain-containing protein [Plantactinospora sp. KLBMP9567]|uniref:LPXTG cell wall anchor domain-containing protein n=1 Tax=Plantactinospora sp. KLBMP9567 TaxID=3085900 RepID=UPI002980F19A|nr:LPXTG cell wall anchor domain-containing protein [Plantactinospora sp. KLBMP9567]MDW5327790.1 LPXTG cell wall anchor domain-containing protein [Plantactinospora sp. KLBMP9567]